MSASGQCPGVSPLTPPQVRIALNAQLRSQSGPSPGSQKSLTMRHMLAFVLRWLDELGSQDWSSGPGERLSTIDRPVLSIALRIASTSAW